MRQYLKDQSDEIFKWIKKKKKTEGGTEEHPSYRASSFISALAASWRFYLVV